MKNTIRTSGFFGIARELLVVWSAASTLLLPDSCTAQSRPSPGAGKDDIRLNQLGYYSASPKKFVVANTTSDRYALVDTLGTTVFEGRLSNGVYWDKSGETVKMADLSEYALPGTYYISIHDKGYSSEFSIRPHLYRNALKASLRSYYLQRASVPIEKKYAGIYARPAGHPDTVCYYHPSTGISTGSKPSPGGWYDAGDYNKYIVNSGISLSMMLDLAEVCPGAVADGFSDIPESGNGTSDLLDELRYNLEWMLTMQDADGGVFHKLTNLGFDAFQMPYKCTNTRYFVGKSTTAALCFAASTAQASRVYAAADTMFASALRTASRRAFDWALSHPDVPFKNPSDVSTGTYADRGTRDEFFWAAAELFRTTGDKRYYDELHKTRRPVAFIPGENWMNYLRNLGYYTLGNAGTLLPASELKGIRDDVLRLADTMIVKLENNPYHVPLEIFEWGSNSDVLDAAMLFAFAWEWSGNTRYKRAMLETTDYIFGKNATAYCFVTGVGSKPPLFPHHRPSAADGIPAPIPGFVVGGPNWGKQDAGNGAAYASAFPARSYVDMQESYASNEICINWNAPLVFVLGLLEASMNP